MAVALLVAAGRGERLGLCGPKAFAMLGGRPMLEWSLEALQAAPSIERVVVAVPPGVERVGGDVVIVPGGASRSESVRNALAAAGEADAVVVHDAARPLLDVDLVERCLAALADADAAIAAAPVADTIKESDGLLVRATLDRSRLWAVQTPQAFRRAALEDALSQPSAVLAAATDDAGLVEARGGTVRLVESSPRNLKVTTPTDLKLAELLLADRLPPPPAPR